MLGVDLEWMIRWNAMALLYTTGMRSAAAGGEICATAGKLRQAYRQRLGGDLRDHAKDLGHASVEDLLRSLFDDKVQAEYGIRTLVDPRHGNLLLATSLRMREARQLASAAGLVQFRPEAPGEGGERKRMMHTGMASVSQEWAGGKRRSLLEEPLGAALRVSPFDWEAERYGPGDELDAFVYSYSAQGDLPLLVLTKDDPRGKGAAGPGHAGGAVRASRRRGEGSRDGRPPAEDAGVKRRLDELRAGDGPIPATVVASSPHLGALFVDCGVGRKRGKKFGGGVEKALGMLRFKDLRAEDPAAAPRNEVHAGPGDQLQVFVKTVSPQSGRFAVTVDPSFRHKKPQDIKRAKQADKRQKRLSQRLSPEAVQALVGREYDGTVKARSKTGDWYYVQPAGEGEGKGEGEDGACALPVGVAQTASGGTSYSAGDRVRVRLEGMDEKRGQLALTLLD